MKPKPKEATNALEGILQSAMQEAHTKRHTAVSPLHLLHQVLKMPDLAGLYAQAGADVMQMTQKTQDALSDYPAYSQGAFEPNLDADVKGLFAQMQQLAQDAGDAYISCAWLVLALAKHKATAKLMQGLDVKRLKDVILSTRQGETVQNKRHEEDQTALNDYTQDLTALASEGKLDPVIGRDDEIRRTMEVLARRTKNNPVLIGHPGVGKTAIVEALAMRIVQDEVPESLKNKRVLSLDLGALVAGAKFQGEFEERLKGVINALIKEEGGIVLFIDEMHQLVGAGKTQGAMDASNLLKPALARGQLHCIGATTLDEYRQYIEKDAALERRFQKVLVDEPSVTDTIAILRGLKARYELHHGVTIQDSAILAAARYSDRYIGERMLPDKAIDLLDEASSRLKIELESKPYALSRLDGRILGLSMQREALKNDTDAGALEQKALLDEQIASLSKEYAKLNEQWMRQKTHLKGAQDIRDALDKAQIALEQATRAGNLEEAARLRYGVLPNLQADLDKEASADQGTDETLLLRDKVTDQEIAQVVSDATGIPVSKMLTSERARLLEMEEVLSSHVVGQKDAIFAVSDAIRRARAGLADPNKPLGSFLFLGPTGVGKTELTQALTTFLFDDARALIRIDMSEYMEKHSVSRLVGAPPGYVGYEEGGVLTEAVRRKPYSVLLFDEVEKAHPDVFNLLLQVLDAGRLTDSQGRVIDFTNTVIIMTGNLGSSAIMQAKDASYETLKAGVMAEVNAYFRPEFINRIDEIVVFAPLSQAHIEDIAKIQFERIKARLADQGISAQATGAAISHIARAGFDVVYGARPLKRALVQLVENPLSYALLQGQFVPGDSILIDVADGALTFTKGVAH